MPVESLYYATSCLMAVGNVGPSITILEIFSQNNFDLDLYNANLVKPKYATITEKPYATSYLITIVIMVMFLLSVTIVEIFHIEICTTMTLTSTFLLQK